MSKAEGEALLQRIYACINAKDIAGIDQVFSEDYQDHNPSAPGPLDREAFKQFLTMWAHAFPDFTFTTSDFIMDGERTAWRWHWMGTHTGDLMGIPPTGKSVSMDGVDYGVMRDGKAVAHWNSQDNLGLMQQLGVIPPMGPPPSN